MPHEDFLLMLNAVERPKTLKENALEQLREAITLGVFKPGERLVERALCDQLGISRTVVRECIRHLESEKLITSIPNAGPSVSVLGEDEIVEIYEIRSLLEVAAVRSCAQQADQETIKQLHHYCDEIAKALKQGDILETLRQTRRLYEIIFTAGNKRVSWDLVDRLNGRISRLRALTLGSEGRWTSGPANLRQIVNAIEQGDSDAAALACQKHISEAANIALQQLQYLQPQV